MPGPVGLLLQGPLAVVGLGGRKAQAVAGGRAGQVFAVQFEGVHAVRYVGGHVSHGIGLAQLTVGNGARQARQFGAADVGRQREAVRGVVDHDLSALTGFGGELADRGGLFRGAGGFHFPELQGLSGDVAVDRGVAAPVLVVVHAQIARGAVAVGSSQVIAGDGPDIADVRLVVDAYAVVRSGHVQVLAAGICDGVAVVYGRDGPAEISFYAVQGQFAVSADRAGGGRGAAAGGCCRRKRPGRASFGHRDGDGLLRGRRGRDVRHLRPDGAVLLRPDRTRRKQAEDHGENQNGRQDFPEDLFHVFPPVFLFALCAQSAKTQFIV